MTSSPPLARCVCRASRALAISARAVGIAALAFAFIPVRAAVEPRLLFRSGFEAETRVADGTLREPASNRQHLAGRDTVTGFDWGTSLVEAGLVTDAFFQYVISRDAKAETFVTTEVREMTGPQGRPSRVLYTGMKGDDPADPALTRNEYDLHPTPAWRQGYARYWMFIQPDLRERVRASSWVMLVEWKEPRDPESTTGGTNNWRANVRLAMEGSELVWGWLRQQVQPQRRDEQQIFNTAAPVPIGRWFQLEMFWRWGREGRVWFAIDGRTVFDQSGRFEHATRPLGLKFWALFKNYRHQHFYDADLRNGDESWFAYDDVEIWSDFPPGHPMRGTEPSLVEEFDGTPDTPWGTLPPDWWLEGEAGGARARIENRRLLVDATAAGSPGATVWLDRELPANVEASFDVHVVESINAANNMNLLFQFRDSQGLTMRETRVGRADGRYNHYHSGRLQGTILTFLANGTPDEARLRVRQVPPFDPVVQESKAYHARAGRTYHVVVSRRGDRFTCEVDGHRLLDTTLPARADAKPGGYLGFRTWRTRLWWDNLMIRPLPPPASREMP